MVLVSSRRTRKLKNFAKGIEGLLAVGEVLGGAACGECGGVLRAASVGRTLSPSASVVVLLKSDFLAYYC